MSAQWSKGFDPALFVGDVAARAKVDGNKVSFKGWMFGGVKSILAERMEFHPEIPAADRPGLFWKALVQAAIKGQLTPQGLVASATDAESIFLQQPINEYILVSSLAVDRSTMPPDGEISGCTLEHSVAGADLSRFDTATLKTRIQLVFEGRELPTTYTGCIIYCRGRTPREAAEKALNAGALSRAIMNLWQNIHVGAGWFSGRPEPINEFLAGPMSTLHNQDGSLATEEFWFEPGYVSPKRPRSIRDYAEFLIFRQDWLGRLQCHPYGGDLREALVRYCSALDEANYDNSIISLWSALELLTGTENAKYDDLVRRASFLYADTAWARSVLSHLRHFRNKSVHHGTSSGHRNDAVHFLRKYVEDLLLFHLNNEVGAKNLTEACEFLNHDPDFGRLRRRAELLNLAIKAKAPRADDTDYVI